MSNIRSLVRMIFELAYLFRTSAPLVAYKTYLKTRTQRKPRRIHVPRMDEFKKIAQKEHFSQDWFTGNIPQWLVAFQESGILDKNINVLEIGSWEGLSSLFILNTLPKAHLTCVDSWQDFDGDIGQDKFDVAESNFDYNLKSFSSRVVKFKGTSLGFFNSCANKPQFDLIYVDGSHHGDDTLIDVIKGFQQLKPGGVMIMDDYLWQDHKPITDNPGYAINTFLKMKNGEFQLMYLRWQAILRKT